jgi:hypothetical protein
VAKLADKNAALVDFLAYDTTLGREQNIDMGKTSALANVESMQIKKGVTLK